MSLFESGASSGLVSLQDLLNGQDFEPVVSELDYHAVVRLICRGGWPGSLGLSDPIALAMPRQYLTAVAQSDLQRLDGVGRDPGRVRAVLAALARNTATQARLGIIHQDSLVERDQQEAGSPSTTRRYLRALDQIFVLDDLPGWIFSLRSRTQMRSSPKRHLADPSLAVAALGATPAKLEADPNTTGFLFESLCVRDLRVYAQACQADVSHYRDNKGLEADAIVEGLDNKWGAIEVKLGRAQVDQAAQNLLRLRKKLTGVSELAPPAFLMVLTATTGLAHTRPDGVHVVPIDCLGP